MLGKKPHKREYQGTGDLRGKWGREKRSGINEERKEEDK